MSKAVIVSAARTAIGKFQGGLQTLTGPHLGAAAIKETLRRADLAGDVVDEVYMGNVLQAGVGQAPARQATMFAGLPVSVPATTINKVCGSGLKAVMLAAQTIETGDNKIVVAGGMESMTNTPYLLDRARSGYRLGHGMLIDGVIKDGLWDVYKDFHMGSAAELTAKELGISREAQDAYAAESYRRALAAIKEGRFNKEIVAVEVAGKKGAVTIVNADEEPSVGDPSKFASLKPAFQKDGTVTAANASSLNDGGAALLVMAEDEAQRRGLKPLATIVAHASHAQASELFTTAPAAAIHKVLGKANLKVDDIDLFEINEAFSVVSLAVNQLATLDAKRVNVNGGAVALGHPIGASGARILVTLLYAMEAQNARRGLASLCIGGGEAVALVVEKGKQVMIKTVGIVGAGQMGRGIAQVSAQAKLDVLLVDVGTLAEQGRNGIEAQLKKQVEKGKLTAAASQETMVKIKAANDIAALSVADIVIEAITEKEAAKRELFANLDKLCPAHTILASNTSSISITALGGATKRPEQVIGMHFMNPVPVMQLVEIIRALQTSDATYASVRALTETLGKVPVVAKEAPGFIVNRILIPMLNEAAFVFEQGLASAADIDAAMKLGTNQPMGPLTLADFIGLDTVLAIAEVLHYELGEDKYRPAPILRRYVAAGWLGKKTGRGFYAY